MRWKINGWTIQHVDGGWMLDSDEQTVVGFTSLAQALDFAESIRAEYSK